MTALKRAFFVLMTMFCLSSCVSYKEPITVPNPTGIIQDFPSKPAVKEYTRQPIIKKEGNDFLVSDEFVENSVLLKKYSDRIDTWKTNNQVQ